MTCMRGPDSCPAITTSVRGINDLIAKDVDAWMMKFSRAVARRRHAVRASAAARDTTNAYALNYLSQP